MGRLAVLAILLPWLAHAEFLTSATCTPAVTTGCFTRNTVGASSVFVDVSGTWTGSIVFEVAGNAAGPWHSSRAYPPDGNGSYAVSVTGNGSWSVPTFGAPILRVRAATLTSGSATVTAQAGNFVIPADVVRAVGGDGGGVMLATPDGGLPVNLGAATVNTVVSTPDGGLRVSLGGDTVATLVMTPDGGLPVSVPDAVRVVGPTFGAVQVSGTVDLSSATLASMGNYVCTSAEAHRLSLTTTPTIIPTTPIANRTSWTLINVDTVGTKTVACRVDPGDGGVPDCTTPGFGLTVFPNGGTLTFPVRESDTVRCRACTATTTVEHVEEACVAP